MFLAKAQTSTSVTPSQAKFYNSGVTGITGEFRTLGLGNTSHTLTAFTDGTGKAAFFGITNTTSSNDALATLTYGTGRAGDFEISSTGNPSDAVYTTTNGSENAIVANFSRSGASSATANNIAIFKANSSNVARIDKTGKGFFNGGTQASGADVAESFNIEGSRSTYEAGDVLVISENSDRTVEKSSEPYSTLVAGVFATKSGLLLTYQQIDTDLSSQVPMGVIGVIPTKVCNEGGTIKRGDLLVTSSKTGYAMKADLAKLQIGQAIGKALQNFDLIEGKIEVLVNVR